MTPLAHRIVKELTLPKKGRHLIDQCGLLSRMHDIHCFDCTEVVDFVSEMCDSMVAKNSFITDERVFLPAPKTWIEFRFSNGVREGVLLGLSGKEG